MISKFDILVLAVLACSVNAAPPSCTCARNFTPVCGSDGTTYSNECLLECAQQTKTDLVKDKEGPCEDTAPACICTMEYNPTCGADGRTYSNPCEARCNKVEVAHPGECQSVLVAQPPCTCDKVKKPVCGSDGITYTNDCLLNCATQYNSRLSIAHSGACKETGTEVHFVDNAENTNQPQCMCPENYSPVCGSDGITYDNECSLNCATQYNSRLNIAREGSCELDAVKVAEPGLNSCTCTRNYSPVCGTDGVTYSNECMLGCAGAKKARRGACELRG